MLDKTILNFPKQNIIKIHIKANKCHRKSFKFAEILYEVVFLKKTFHIFEMVVAKIAQNINNLNKLLIIKKYNNYIKIWK